MGVGGDPGRNWLREKHSTRRGPLGRGREELPRSRLESWLCSYWHPSFHIRLTLCSTSAKVPKSKVHWRKDLHGVKTIWGIFFESFFEPAENGEPLMLSECLGQTCSHRGKAGLKIIPEHMFPSPRGSIVPSWASKWQDSSKEHKLWGYGTVPLLGLWETVTHVLCIHSMVAC